MRNDQTPGAAEGFDPAEYQDEARDRWGGTDAYRESARRTGEYTEEVWAQIGREASEIDAAFIALLEAGASAHSADARAAALRHRAHISRWFYECTAETHAGLGAMYASDERFTERIDRAAPGLACFMSEAIAAAARSELPGGPAA